MLGESCDGDGPQFCNHDVAQYVAYFFLHFPRTDAPGPLIQRRDYGAVSSGPSSRENSPHSAPAVQYCWSRAPFPGLAAHPGLAMWDLPPVYFEMAIRSRTPDPVAYLLKRVDAVIMLGSCIPLGSDVARLLRLEPIRSMPLLTLWVPRPRIRAASAGIWTAQCASA